MEGLGLIATGATWMVWYGFVRDFDGVGVALTHAFEQRPTWVSIKNRQPHRDLVRLSIQERCSDEVS